MDEECLKKQPVAKDHECRYRDEILAIRNTQKRQGDQIAEIRHCQAGQGEKLDGIQGTIAELLEAWKTAQGAVFLVRILSRVMVFGAVLAAGIGGFMSWYRPR